MDNNDATLRKRVLNLLLDGFGVEDVALMVTRDVAVVRECVTELRADGSLCKAFQVPE